MRRDRSLTRALGCSLSLILASVSITLAQTPPRAAQPTAKPAAKPAAASNGQAPQTAPPADPARMQAILEAWSERSKAVKTLNARFTREDVSQVWQDKTRYEGQAFLQSPNLAYLNFEKVAEDGKPKPHERIVCTGDRVYHFLAETKQVHVYSLAAEERQRALEEGPLPFLFNMNAENARARYRMTLKGEDAQRYLIEIEPIQAVDKEAFSKAMIWLDRAKLMPTHIRLYDPSNAQDTQTFAIKDVQPNPKIAPSYFDGPGQTRQVQSAQWDVVEYDTQGRKIGAAAEAEANAAGTPAAQPVQPAARPSMTGPRR